MIVRLGLAFETPPQVMVMRLDRITVDPQVCMGQPMIRGIRITVAFVLKQLASGQSKQEILKAYPELEEEDLRQAYGICRLAGRRI